MFEEEHRSVPCEVCHAPVTTHAESGEQIAQMAVLRSYRLCAYCHQRLRARPPSFPQVILSDHVRDKGGVLVEDVCLECHDAHDPLE
ncbi:MAG: cytochrome c3 family protein [Dehalococcoidia bacterium]